MTDREQLRTLVDKLPDAEVHPALRFLEFLAERGAPPALRALALVPEDDEPTTDEDRAALAEAREELAAGRTIPHDDLCRELFGEGQKRRPPVVKTGRNPKVPASQSVEFKTPNRTS